MLFNSIAFSLFFSIVFLLYWLVFNKKTTSRNSFILIVSYTFYGMWDWRFLSLIIISSFIDFYVGKKLSIEIDKSKRKALLMLSILVNLGSLGFFKYYNFFIDSFIDSFALLGINFSHNRLNIILPVGISFYTFQTLSYTLDIYKKKIEPSKNWVSFFAFVSFFPQLVAGPIERAKDLLPQFDSLKKANYNNIKSGLLLMAWGLFKKIMLADRLAIFVDSVYQNTSEVSGIPVLIATIFFGFQLYLDFSAYSDIAIGIARTLGFKLSTNFKHPYLASSFSDFWNRWHISLSSWFRDYVYIPLGGSRNSKQKTILNILIVFTLSGLWHGASWNFVIWGILNAFFLILLDNLFIKSPKKNGLNILKSITVSSFWMLSLVFFRAQTFSDALNIFKSIGFSNTEKIYDFGLNIFEIKFTFYLLIGLILFEILKEKRDNLYEWFISRSAFLRWSFYVLFISSIIMYGSYGINLNDQSFIYFQF